MVLVTGAAGTGKTTVVLQWVAGLGPQVRVAWLTLDPRDNEPHRFWSALAEALTLACPELDWRPRRTAHARIDPGDIDRLLEGLASIDPPLVVVLDDLHFVVDESILADMDLLAAGLPEGVLLVLVSRGRPELRLARLAASRQLVEITGRDLQFTLAETRTFLRDAGLGKDWATRAGARLVQNATGGWAVAVSLTARLSRSGRPLGPRDVQRARRDIARYLTEEVLQSQPDEVRDFLLDTSVLDEITIPVANAVRHRDDAADFLDHLDRHDLFVSQVFDRADLQHWRVHAVVRDYLRGRLEDHDPERFAELNRRAGQYFASLDPAQAIGHALAGGDFALAADLVEAETAAGPEHERDYSTLLGWLEALPLSLFADRAALRAMGVNIAFLLGRTDLAGQWLRARVVDDQTSLEDVAAEAWQASAVGDVPRLREMCLVGLSLCDASSYWWRGLHGSLAAAEVAMGNVQDALRSLLLLPRDDVDTTPPELFALHELIRVSIAVLQSRLGDPICCCALA